MTAPTAAVPVSARPRVPLPADPRARAALVIGGALLVFAVVLAVVARVAPSPHGPVSSSFATSSLGLAAYAALLDREGRPVRRAVTPVAERAPARGETLVVLDPDVVEPEEARAIGRWVRSGGRLLAGGRRDSSWLNAVLGRAPEWQPEDPERSAVLVPVPETAGVTAVTPADGGGWRALGRALPILGPPAAPLATVSRSGRGTVVLLADASPLQNRLLGRGDGAALGLALAGDRPVAFLETVHGYGVSRGLSALPDRVKWTLIGLLATGLLALWTAGRRLGPAEEEERPPAPARIEYVDALAGALARTEKRARRRTPPPGGASPSPPGGASPSPPGDTPSSPGAYGGFSPPTSIQEERE